MIRFALFMLFTLHSVASASTTTEPPEEMAKWKDWIIAGFPEHACPYFGQRADSKKCAWPGTLKLKIDSNGADFTQTWTVFEDSWISLVGNEQLWPERVSVYRDKKLQKSAVVLSHNGRPRVRLESGRYDVTGRLRWFKQPQSLPIPSDSAIIQLDIDGKRVALPDFDESGRLWLQRAENRTTQSTGKGDDVKVEVFRRLTDAVPMRSKSILKIAISGEPREILLGRFLPQDSEILSLISPLPARIEDNGDLLIQARSGTWEIELNARYKNNPTSLRMNRSTENWPEQETWSFKSANALRGVKISGPQTLDPTQIDLPRPWHELPTYLVTSDSNFHIEEQYRGDTSNSSNHISLQRNIFLDFDGAGATISDHLSGTVDRTPRLSAQPTLDLGRASLRGEPQLITQLEGESSKGVEIRNTNLNLNTVSRLENIRQLTATGWQHNIASLSVDLELPPGWRLWHVSGPDEVTTSWLSRWTLWDIFLCLLISGAIFKLMGARWAILSLATFALNYHENNMPLISWLILIFALPLLRVLPIGKARSAINIAAYLTLFGLALGTLVFAVQQIRTSLYPQLEHRNATATSGFADTQRLVGKNTPRKVSEFEISSKLEGADLRDTPVEPEIGSLSVTRKSRSKPTLRQRYEPDSYTQTGPGQAIWRWNTVNLNWSGPVAKGAPLAIYLTGPLSTSVLLILQTLMVVLLGIGFALTLIRTSRANWGTGSGMWGRATTNSVNALLISFMAYAVLPTDAMASTGFPPEYLMNTWQQRLLESPECLPDCVSIDSTRVLVEGDQLTVTMLVSSGINIGLPIDQNESWQLQRVLVDNKESQQFSLVDEKIWLNIPKGKSEVQIQALVRDNTVNLSFPLDPHNIALNAAGWDAFGLQNYSLPNRTLELQKRKKTVQSELLVAAPIAPFVTVRRNLQIDLDWRLTTHVWRVAPEDGGFTVKIPLIKNEIVISEDIEVIREGNERYIVIGFKLGQTAFTWNSIFEPSETISLVAATHPWLTETWHFSNTPRWHAKFSGLTPAKGAPHKFANTTWHPWPKEQVSISLTKPNASKGPSTTIEAVEVIHNLGERSSDVTLKFQLLSSVGGDFVVPAPPDATLKYIRIDGRAVTVKDENKKIVLPLRPGLQSAEINWIVDGGATFRTSTLGLELPLNPNNISLSLNLPQSRWPLFVGGPNLGPAMLLWGVLIVILCLAVGLGYVVKRQNLSIPVNTTQWVLLALGMSSINILSIVPVVLWFFAMEARSRLKMSGKHSFNLLQVGLAALTIIAIYSLFLTIPASLLSAPDMQVVGNGSSNYYYSWYQDRAMDSLPQGYVISVSIWVYRLSMLLWSLWLVFALLKWAAWSWQCFSQDKIWHTDKVVAE